ncbi:MAG: branched-chain amino acid ABC transporter permease, partial [Pseudomonadota bacterium]
MLAYRRDIIAFGLLIALYAAIFQTLGTAYSTRMLVEATCYAIIALGLTIQWGYAGLFNVGIMGLV